MGRTTRTLNWGRACQVALAIGAAGCGGTIADDGGDTVESDHRVALESTDEHATLESLAYHTGTKHLPNNVPFGNPSGAAATYSTSGSIDLTGPFFQDLGINDRSCATCHQVTDGWSITPPHIRERFESTGGRDPLFRTMDGSNSPLADVSSVAARRKAYSMLLTKGLIRVGIAVPDSAEFTVVAIDDPYHFASSAELSLFRRPLPTTNLAFLSTVMWDGRETALGADHCNHADEGGACFASMSDDFVHQSNTATQGHAQAPNPIDEVTRAAIVQFEASLFTAQIFDRDAHRLDVDGALGGPRNLARAPFYYGINDNLGDYQTGAPFTSDIFSEYGAWATPSRFAIGKSARKAVARGEALFNSRPITISGVAGLNFAAPFNPPLPASFSGTCGTCHDSPSAGNHSIAAPLNIGLTDASRRTPDMPLYTLQKKTTLETVQTTDPGRALVTGKWADVGKFKGPVLRGLAARAPYFHNGFAKDLDAVVDFYNDRFSMGLTASEHDDLVAFLSAL